MVGIELENSQLFSATREAYLNPANLQPFSILFEYLDGDGASSYGILVHDVARIVTEMDELARVQDSNSE